MTRPRRRRRTNPSTGRPTRSQRIGRNETFRSMNRIGKGATAAFLAMPVLGLILISQSTVQVTLPASALYAALAGLTSIVLGTQRSRKLRP
ncbi:hypothetical protein KPP03845_200160 (plasmid) [Streptomyces xanthophaeus]|nr:hypothetical protein KPP03845_200160 [Streptomyces xanthophaeus]